MLHDAIKLGPFLIKNLYLFIFISGFIAYIIMKKRLKTNSAIRDPILNYILNSLMMWVILWKFSYILFYGVKAFANPQTIFFFSGGLEGAIFATFAALGYLFFKIKKEHMNKKVFTDALIIGVLSFLICFHTILFFIDYEALKALVIVLIATALLLVYSKLFPLHKDIEKHERMKEMKKIIAIIVFIGLIGYTIYTTAFTEKVEIVGLEKGNLAPDFELVTLDGEKMKLSDYRGKKVFLNFWASWCGPCRAEMPDMQELQEEGREDLVILAVNANQTETNEKGPQQFVDEHGLTFPILIDKDGKVSKQYQVIGLPTTFFIDAEGKIQDKFTGTLSYEQMINGISKLD